MCRWKYIYCLLELNMLCDCVTQVEGEREDSRAIENCYKLKLKRLFDQRIADIERVHHEKHQV